MSPVYYQVCHLLGGIFMYIHIHLSVHGLQKVTIISCHEPWSPIPGARTAEGHSELISMCQADVWIEEMWQRYSTEKIAANYCIAHFTNCQAG